LTRKSLINHCRIMSKIKHSQVLNQLLNQIDVVDFREYASIMDEKNNLNTKHYLVGTIEKIVELAKNHGWGLCRKEGFSYLFNGEFWETISDAELKSFLGQAAEKMGVDKFEARVYSF